MRKERKILYLDQFAVSNMYDAAPTTADVTGTGH